MLFATVEIWLATIDRGPLPFAKNAKETANSFFRPSASTHSLKTLGLAVAGALFVAVGGSFVAVERPFVAIELWFVAVEV